MSVDICDCRWSSRGLLAARTRQNFLEAVRPRFNWERIDEKDPGETPVQVLVDHFPPDGGVLSVVWGRLPQFVHSAQG
jgi:hypothetical protein